MNVDSNAQKPPHPTPHRRKHERKDFAFGISLGEWATAAAMGIAGAALTATKTIRDRFMKDLKNSVEYEDHFKKHAEALSEIRFIGKEGNPSKYEGLGAKAFPTFVKDILELKKKQYNEVSKWAREYRGVEDSWIKGTIQRFKVQSKRSRASIIFSAIVGAAVGAGMTLSFFNGVATRDKIERIEDTTTAIKDALAGSNPPERDDAALLDQEHPNHHHNHHMLPRHRITDVKDHGRVAASDPNVTIQA